MADTARECDLMEFPRLDEEQLRNLAYEIYQRKLSPSFIQEHIKGECVISFHDDNDRLLRVQIQSCHTSSKQYVVSIDHPVCSVDAWYSTCKAGARIVGKCSQIATIIWCLAKGRVQGETYG